MLRSVLSFIFLILFTAQSYCATYYIDYNAADDSANGTSTDTPWKRAPGMVGFAGSYTHDDTNGDTFVFKGGVTWPYISGGHILEIQNSGPDGKTDTYTGGNNPTYNWGTGYPVFNAGNHENTIAGIKTYTGSGTKVNSNLIIEYIKITGIGDSSVGSGTGIAATYGGSNITVRYNYLSPNCVNVWDYSAGSGTYSNINIHHNTIRQFGRLNFGTGNIRLDGVNIYNNTFEGGWDFYPSGSYHTDGIMINADGVEDYAIKNMSIYNNLFWGDWQLGGTAFIYLSGATLGGLKVTQGTKIYNNIIAPSNTAGAGGSAGTGILVKYGHDDVQIYNNTIDYRSITNEPSFGIVAFSSTTEPYTTNTSNVHIKNNIILGFFRGIQRGYLGGTNTMDNNSFYANTRIYLDTPNGGNAYTTCAAAQAAGFMTTYCSDTDPLFVENITAADCSRDTMTCDAAYGISNGNLSLQAGSPAKDHGADLSAIFTTDYPGNIRSGTWDIGAYEVGASADETAPTIESVTVNAAGTGLTIAFNETITVSDSSGFTLNMSGGAAGLTYKSGSGSNTLIYDITGRAIATGETGSLDYVTVLNSIEDMAGNDLASTGESDEAVTNNSENTFSETTYTITVENGNNTVISPATNQVVVAGEDSTMFTCMPINSGWRCKWGGTCGATGSATTYQKTAIGGDCLVTLTAEEKYIFK